MNVWVLELSSVCLKLRVQPRICIYTIYFQKLPVLLACCILELLPSSLWRCEGAGAWQTPGLTLAPAHSWCSLCRKGSRATPGPPCSRPDTEPPDPVWAQEHTSTAAGSHRHQPHPFNCHCSEIAEFCLTVHLQAGTVSDNSVKPFHGPLAHPYNHGEWKCTKSPTPVL